MKRIACVGVLGLLAACAAGRASGIRAKFADETGCPESSVSVFTHSNARFTASGCDRSRVYTCRDLVSSDTGTCTAGGPEGPASPPAMRPTTLMDNPHADVRR